MQPATIRRLRYAIGSQRKFATVVGVSTRTVARWERGESRPGKWKDEILWALYRQKIQPLPDAIYKDESLVGEMNKNAKR